MTNAYHVPVLLEASIEALKLGDGSGAWMDATFGGGGHSRIILENLNHYRDFISTDQISKAILLLWSKKHQGIINIANGKKTLKNILNCFKPRGLPISL